MPSILSDADKEVVKRTIPKASNKIQAVAVAKLYVVLPGQQRWTYTGLQGAAVLSNDLVGNTFWIKLVDVSPSKRGVIWDQEIYDTFQYNQDRTFFHSFELEQCLAGLSFVDEKEAKQFKKKMDEREKNASKATQKQPFGSSVSGGQVYQQNGAATKSHSRVGNFLRGHRHSSNPPPQTQSMYIPPPQPIYGTAGTSRPHSSSEIDLADPSWRPILDELLQMGITEDQIAANADFIKAYVEKKQAEEMANGIAAALPDHSKARAPPPPPPAAPPSRISPQNTGATTSTSSSRRGPPPAPPPSRRPAGRAASPPAGREDSPPRTPSPPSAPQPRFRAPPPLADAGKFANDTGPSLRSPARARASSASVGNPGPPPPPRPPKDPLEEDSPPAGFRVPPPFTGDRKSSAPPLPPSRGPVPPPPPARGPVPPPPPSRETPSAYIPPPPLPSKQSGPPPPPPGRDTSRPVPPPPGSTSSIPPPPPPPPFPSSSHAPPPPPLPPSGSGPPPPPPPPPGGSSAPPLPKISGGDGRDDLLASIRAGSKGGGLRKVNRTEIRDRSAAAVPGTEAAAPPLPSGGGNASPAADAGGLAGALAAALSQRKKKVSGSDDEKDDDDDW